MPERMSAFERIVELVAVRDRSSSELRERLRKDTYDTSSIDEALERALACNLVNDARFVDAFIRGKVSAGKGVRAIERELEKHEIAPDDIVGWPESYGLDDEAQLEQAITYLDNHPPRTKDIWAGAYRKLVSRGFSPDVVSRACRIWVEGQRQ